MSSPSVGSADPRADNLGRIPTSANLRKDDGVAGGGVKPMLRFSYYDGFAISWKGEPP